MNVRRVCSPLGWPLVLFVAASSFARPAFAADPSDALTAAWTDRARDLYNEGRGLYAQEKWAKAHAAFRAAEGVKNHWQIAAMLGHCETRLGRFRDAAEHLAWALRVAAGSPSTGELMSMQDALELSRAHLGAMTVQADLAGAEIVVDDAPVGTAPLLDPVFVAPGRHRFEARATERTSVQTTVELQAGDSQVMVLSFANGAARVTTVAPTKSSRDAGAIEDRGMATRTIALLGGAGLTAIALGVGVAYSLKRSSADNNVASSRSTAVQEHGAGGCADPQWAQVGSCAALRNALDRRDSASHAATIGYVATGALAATTVATWLLWPSKAQATRVIPTMGGVLLTGSF
jgi:hypothetical protein